MTRRLGIVFCFIFQFLWVGRIQAQTDSGSTSLSFDLGITRGRNINLWPFFKRYKDQDKKELQIAYPLFSKTMNYRLGIKHSHAIPFYISDSNHTISETRLLSLYYPSVFHLKKRNESGDLIRTFNFLELAPNISMLGLSRSSKGLFVENNMFFFIWYKRDSIQNKSRFIVFPLYWYKSSSYASSHLLLPAFYHYKNEGYKKLNIALLYQHEKYSKKNSHRLFPLWWYKNIYQQDDTTYRRVSFPVYWSRKNNTVNNKAVFPLVFSYKNPGYASLTIFPLFSKGHSPDQNTRHFDILPLYWYHKNPLEVNHVLFPFWWYTKSPLETTRTLFPVYWNKTAFVNDDILRKTTVFPFYWSTRTSYKNNKVVFPLVFSFRDTGSKSLTVFPLFSSGSSTNRSWHYLNIYPFYLHKRNPQKSAHIVLPFWWSLHTYSPADTSSFRILFPLYWASKDKAHSNHILFPLVYSLNNSERKSFTFFPFYTIYRNRHTSALTYAVTPIWWHQQTPEKTSNTLFPVYWHVKTAFRQHHVFFPFVFSYRDTAYRSFTFLPLFSAGRSINGLTHHFHLFPLYWHHQTSTGRSSVVFPVWWHYRNYSSTDTSIFKSVFPVYWSFRNNQKNNQVLFPFVYRFKNPSFQSFTLFPFYSYGRYTNTNYGYHVITPLYWKIKTDHGTTDLLLPLYLKRKTWNETDTAVSTVILPLYFSGQNDSLGYRIILPLWYQFKSPNYKSLTVLPFFSGGSNTDKTEKHLNILLLYWQRHTPAITEKTLIPFWWYTQTHESGDTVTNRTLLPLYWSSKSREDQNRVFFPLIWQFNNRTRWKSFTFFPLFSAGKNKTYGNSYLAITPLYWHYREDNLSRHIVFPLWWSKTTYYSADTTTKHTLFPLYWAGRGQNYHYHVLFPVVFNIHTQNYHSFTFFPLFSAGRSANRDDKYVMVTPLSGWFKDRTHSRFFIFPLYHHRKTPSKTHTSVLLFGYRRTREASQTRTSVLWPLCEKFSSPTYHAFRAAPFIWRTKTDTSSMLALLPLSYHYSSATRQTLRIGWFLYHYNKIPRTVVSHNLLWKMYERHRYQNGSYETRLLHLLYANVNLPEKREKSVFPFYYSVTYANGDKSVSVLFSFYNYFKQYKPDIKEYYQEERIFWFLRLRSNYEQLKRNGKDFKRR